MSRKSWMTGVASLCCAGGVLAALLVPVEKKSAFPAAIVQERASRPRADLGPGAADADDVASAAPLIVEAPSALPEPLRWISGGRFRMGSDPPDADNLLRIKADEVPAHDVELDGFWMADHEVTNREFEEFVRMSRYVTFAEKQPTPEEIARSGADIHRLRGTELHPGSMCFNPDFSGRAIQLRDEKAPLWELNVWQYVDGADWRHPAGADSGIAELMDHPVVHISWEDAVAYCQWAGIELPTEAQWEYAARGGRDASSYPWGDDRERDGKCQCNYWQGSFPDQRLNLDGYEGTAPVKSFSPNGYGLYDMSGNVWEWCADFYNADYYAVSPRRNPAGAPASFDPNEPQIIKRVTRGGSFLCNVNSCTGYRCSARMGAEFNSGTFHTGFRGVVNARRHGNYVRAQERIAQWRRTADHGTLN